MNMYHIPVLKKEVIDFLNIQPNGLYVDATFGGGGHAEAILSSNPTCRLIAFDWDKQAIDLHKEKFTHTFGDRIMFVWANFSHITSQLKKIGITKVDGILADFGTSRFQLTQGNGFSFAHTTPLDMRMSIAHQQITAADILKSGSREELSKIFWEYGEERYSRQIAEAIVLVRRKHPIVTTAHLVKIIDEVIPFKKKIHKATKIFQALRITVNNELKNIEIFLPQALDLIGAGGRLVSISFHSKEDERVKHFFKQNTAKGVIITKKVVTPQLKEMKDNPASRSSRLRVFQKI